MSKTTVQEAETVRDFLADHLLDGRRVISVGIGSNEGVPYVGVTANGSVSIPALPTGLAHVPVVIKDAGGVARAHTRATSFLSRVLRRP